MSSIAHHAALIAAAGGSGKPYWRVYVDTSAGASIGFAELQFIDASGNRLPTTAGSAMASAFTLGNGPANAFSGDAFTNGWISGSAAPQWIGYNFGTAVDVRGVVIFSNPTSPASQGGPSSFRLQSSLDGSAWSDEQTFSGIGAWSPSEVRMFHPSGHRYWRLFVTKVGNMTQRHLAIGAMGYLVQAGDAQGWSPTRGTRTAAGSNVAQGITHVFADLTGANVTNANTFDDMGLSTVGPWWLSVDMVAGSKFLPREMFIYPQFHVPENTDRTPVDFVIQWSDDNLAWTDYKTVVGLSRAWALATEYRVNLDP